MDKHKAIFMYEKRRRIYYAREGSYSVLFERWNKPAIYEH